MIEREKKELKPVQQIQNDWGIEVVTTSQENKKEEKTVKIEEG